MSDRFNPIVQASEDPAPAPVEPAKPSLAIKLPQFDIKTALPWIVVAGLVVFIAWDRRGDSPDAGIDVRKPVARFHELLCENLAVANESLADFCEGRNPDPSDIIEKSKELVSSALRDSGKALAEMDNKYLRDGTPSERAEYLRSIANELRGWK